MTEKIIVDYFEKTTGSEDRECGIEYTVTGLFENGSKRFEVAEYRDPSSAHADKFAACAEELINNIAAIVSDSQMEFWNEMNCDSLDVKRIVFRFENDSMCIRVTSDEMPECGETAFYKIKHILVSAINEARND